jgi:hypothetical protein
MYGINPLLKAISCTSLGAWRTSTMKPLTSTVLTERWSWANPLKFLPFLHDPLFMFRLGHGVVGVLAGRVGIMEGRPQGRVPENQFAIPSLTAWREQPLSVFIGWL